jgi:hypothetical protein
MTPIFAKKLLKFVPAIVGLIVAVGAYFYGYYSGKERVERKYMELYAQAVIDNAKRNAAVDKVNAQSADNYYNKLRLIDEEHQQIKNELRDIDDRVISDEWVRITTKAINAANSISKS